MNNNLWWMMGLAVLIGAILPLQGLVNARLGAAIGGPFVAAFVSFLIGTVVLGVYLLLTRQNIDIVSGPKLPLWIWSGGLLGAVYVAIFTVLIPRLGAASIMCLLIFGQVTAALLLERYGVLQAQRSIDWIRLLGAVLVLVGVVLVATPWRKSVASLEPQQRAQRSTGHP